MIPAGCPRGEATTEPVSCEFVLCRHHCGGAGLRGPLSQIRRRPLSTGDDCTLTIAARGTHSYGQIAAALGISRSAARRTLLAARRKRLAVAALVHQWVRRR